MKTGNIIAYRNDCGKIKKAVIAKTYKETPHTIRIFDMPLSENSKSYVIGLNQEKIFGFRIKDHWDYQVTDIILKKEEESLLETLIKKMGPISDIR